MLDLVIRNGSVIDGTGNVWFKADVGVKNGKITRVGNISESESDRVIDATGLVVCPGFIDVHTHSEMSVLINPKAETTVRMGGTTHIVGNCGSSPAPLTKEAKKTVSSQVGTEWDTLEEYFKCVETRGLAINIGTMVGHGTIRDFVMGTASTAPTNRELSEMKRLVDEAMQQGAFGLSSGLVFAPGRFAKTDELVELCKVVAKNGGIYASHVRSQSDMYEDAVAEAIEICEKSGVSVQLSHQCVMPPHWGKKREVFGMIQRARERGLDITIDVVAGLEGVGSLNDMFPPWAVEGGIKEQLKRFADHATREKLVRELKGETNWNRNIPALWAREGRWDLMRIHESKEKAILGKTIDEVAKLKGKDPFNFLFDYLIEEGEPRGIIEIVTTVEDLEFMSTLPFQMFSSDVWPVAPYGPLAEGASYPTQYGCYPWIFRKFVREDKILRLEEAVRKLTSFPAQKFHLWDRGLIREGMWADIVVFDPKAIAEKCTWENIRQYPMGIKFVLVNGKIVVENGEHTGILAGKILRHTTECG